MNKTLKFLGSDAGFGRENNSAYIEIENKLILIDCGFTVFEKVIDNFNLNSYDDIEIIITHLHNDHAGSLSQIILYAYSICNKKVRVISGCEHIDEYLSFCGTPKDAYELVTETDNITMIKTEHTPYLDAYGFQMLINGKNIIYTGDTNTFNPFLPYINEADELYIDVSKSGGVHIKIEDIYEKLKQIKSNGTDIYLMHIDDKKYVADYINGEFELA
ncbi:MAG: MBL fold metallo-hydrolase [Clostridia bacterium]|nr:MBL fold metallo-hydrolase [Clostridia bacterium]